MSKKGVYFKNNKWIAQYWNTELKKTIAIGVYGSEEEAIEARARYIRDVYDGIIDESLPKTKGLPKGITKVKNKYAASLQFKYNKKHINVHLGVFESIAEAVYFRNKFIESLK